MTVATAKATGYGRWDRVGILASAACTVHCLIAPVLFLCLPQVAGVWAHPASHALVALVVLPLAATVIRTGYRTHRRKWVVAASLLGIGFIVVGSVVPYVDTAEHHPAAATENPAPASKSCCPQVVEGESGERHLLFPAASIVTAAGSVLLISSHIGNLIACRRCRSA